jgi:glyoxylase-like metal-dependent hydrolase (beta-lactamase superfamily II)
MDALSPSSFHIINDHESISIGEFVFKFYYSPGHSEGSICIGQDNMIFTGDRLMKNYKIVTNPPGGC